MTTEETEPQTEVVEVTEEMLASLAAPQRRVVTPIDVVARAMAQIRLSGPMLKPAVRDSGRELSPVEPSEQELSSAGGLAGANGLVMGDESHEPNAASASGAAPAPQSGVSLVTDEQPRASRGELNDASESVVTRGSQPGVSAVTDDAARVSRRSTHQRATEDELRDSRSVIIKTPLPGPLPHGEGDGSLNAPVPTAPDPVPFALQPAPTAPRPPPVEFDPEVRRVTLEKPLAVEAHPTREIPRAQNDQLSDEELAVLKKDRSLLIAAAAVVTSVLGLAVWSFVPSSAPETQYASRKAVASRVAPRAPEKTAPVAPPAPVNPWQLEPAHSSLDTFAVNGGEVLLDPTHRYRVRVISGAAGVVSARVQTANQPWGPLYPLGGPALRVTGATGLRLHCEPRGKFSPDDVLEVELSDLAMRREKRFTLNVLKQCFDFSGFTARSVAEPMRLFLPAHASQPKAKVAWQLARADGTFEAGTLSAGQSVLVEPGQVRLALLSHTLESKDAVTLQPLPPEGDVAGVAGGGARVDWERRPNVALVPPVVTAAPSTKQAKLPEAWPADLEVER